MEDGIVPENEYWISLTDDELTFLFKKTHDISTINWGRIILWFSLFVIVIFIIPLILYNQFLFVVFFVAFLIELGLIVIISSFLARKKTEIIFDKTSSKFIYRKLDPERLLFESQYSEIVNVSYCWIEFFPFPILSSFSRI